MATKVKFERSFGAASLFLECCAPMEREHESELRAKNIVELLSLNRMSRADELQCMELVWQKARLWKKEDLERIVRAIQSSAAPLRRSMQHWGQSCLHIFSAAEIERWKSTGDVHSEGILADIIQRVKAIGGKTLDEGSKKTLISLWLHFRGGFWNMAQADRSVQLQYAQAYFKKQFKHFQPTEERDSLPCEFEELRRQRTTEKTPP